MERLTINILVVDDYEPWRTFACLTLQKRLELKIVGEASDGLEAVAQAQKLQPDLVLLDIGLPTLNGIEAARRIREVCPSCKILFVSENRSRDIAEAALSTGAFGYAVKSGGATEVVNAVKAVLEGTQFVSTHLTGHHPRDQIDKHSIDHRHSRQDVATIQHQTHGHKSGHDVSLYPNDATFVDGLVRFVTAALKNGDAAVVVATESHQEDILELLHRGGVDIPGAVESQRYIAFNVADSFPTLVVNSSGDGVLCARDEHSHLLGAVKAATKRHLKVAVG